MRKAPNGVSIARFFFTQASILWKALCSPTSCWLAKAAALFGISYFFLSSDLVPDKWPVSGYWDDVGTILICFVGSRALVPARLADEFLQPLHPIERPTRWQHVQFMIRNVRSDLANFALYQHRASDAFLITSKNSGTHWLRFMLSCALAKQYDLPRPRYASGEQSNAILGHPRLPSVRPGMPRITSTHTVPSIICGWPWLAWVLPHPPVVVLVRDIKAAMASHYVKWRNHMAEPFPLYLRGDPSGRRYKADIWWYIRFFNRWGDLARANPNKILIVRYEDLQAHPDVWLRNIASHCRIDLDQKSVEAALCFSSREAIRSQLDPSDTEIIVPSRPAATSVEYHAADEAFVRHTIRRYLRHDFGYGYLKGA